MIVHAIGYAVAVMAVCLALSFATRGILSPLLIRNK